jgi:inosine-uridine nucleoside N-ribohydrolase
MTKKIFLDVDTGGDDAVAILLAGHHPKLDLQAVTVCHGNGPLAVCFDNTLRVVEAGGLQEVPVYAGAYHPLIADPIDSHPIQKSALPLPEPTMAQKRQHAVDFLVEYYMGPSGPETIYAPLAPHTNLALALRLEPRLAERIPRIVTMAGAYIEGNTTPSAEFNILADPEAAYIVFNAGIPITMVGLEVTSLALVTLDDVEDIDRLGTPQAAIAARIMHNEVRWFMDNLGMSGGQIYDACAVAAVADSDILTTTPMHVDIELHGSLTRGRTVADISSHHQNEPNVDVGVHIDRDRFLELLVEGFK